MGKVSSSPLERGEVTVAVRVRGPAEILGSFADDRLFDTLQRGEIIRLGLIAHRERREKPSLVGERPVQKGLFADN